MRGNGQENEEVIKNAGMVGDENAEMIDDENEVVIASGSEEVTIGTESDGTIAKEPIVYQRRRFKSRGASHCTTATRAYLSSPKSLFGSLSIWVKR